MESSLRKRRAVAARIGGASLKPVADAFGANDLAAIAALKTMASAIEKINITKTATSTEQRAGFIFEEWHAGTFNAAARKAGDPVTRAMTGTAGGFNNDTRVDLRVVRSETILVEAQAKVLRTAGRTAVAVADPKYAGLDRLVPSDQAAPAKAALLKSTNGPATLNSRLAARRLSRGEAAKRITDKLDGAGHASRPIEHGDVQRLARGDSGPVARLVATETAIGSARSGAKAGATMGGAFCAMGNAAAALSGRKELGDAVADTVAGTASAAVRGAATSVVAEGVKVAVTLAAPATVARTILRGSGPMAAAGALVDIVGDAATGKLTPRRAGRAVTRAAAGWGGAEAGAAFGSVILPGVGTLVGGVLGGILGSMLADSA